MPEEPTYKYDVAFSFLAADLGVAKDLASRLSGLAVFVFDRFKEDLIGRDGMDGFSEVFRLDTRLTVILFRKGWGETAWTGFEESAIKSRALETRFTSLMVVKLDETPLPTWIPSQQLYASEASDTRPEIAAIIRARAKERGAIVRTLGVAEMAIQRAGRERAREQRELRKRSHGASDEIKVELRVLFAEIQRLVEEISAGDPEVDVRVGWHGETCVISSSRISRSLILYSTGNTLRDLVLRVNDWQGPHTIPTPQQPNPSGGRHVGATHYVPVISEDDLWVWESQANVEGGDLIFINATEETYHSKELADKIVRGHIERLFGS